MTVPTSRDATMTIGGVPIRSTTKLWWPEEGITKGDVARYYDEMSPRILPWIAERPLVAERCPDGMRGSCFFQKNFVRGMPADVPRAPIVAKSTGRTVHYVIGSKKTLLALVNLGCIAIHTMNCRVKSLDEPDWLAFDIDPSSGQFADAAKAGRILHRILQGIGVRSYPKTSGARGLHVFVPLRRGAEQSAVRAFARAVGRMVAEHAPDEITVNPRKSARRGRVFMDAARNAFGQTIVVPYSIRRRPHAPVSTPLDWDEVRPSLVPARFNVRTVERRLAAIDPWADFWRCRQAPPELT